MAPFSSQSKHEFCTTLEVFLMAADGTYIADELAFKDYAYRALVARFQDRAAFEHFYASLSAPSKKDGFLRVASLYLHLVKEGDWQLAVEGKSPDYIPNSFKLVGLFALIESLSDEKYQDFYEWLCREDPNTLYPISNRNALSVLNRKYKNSYGSIRRCVTFFQRLPTNRREELCNAIRVGGQTLASIEKVAEFLYDLRSKFVHEAELVLGLGELTYFSMKKEKVVQTELSIDTLLEAFEEGVLAYFHP
jgi:hypothetical protein